MSTKTDFLLQLLQKLGAPLAAAVGARTSGDAQRDAGVMASLLSETVKASIALSQAMNLKPGDGDGDAIRVALAKLAAGMIAESFAQTGRLPNDADGQRLSKLLESVIVFSDNFSVSTEHAGRLKMLDSTPPFFDPVQTNIYAMNALLPAIGAIAEFSFAQNETKLAQDVAQRLKQESQAVLSQAGLPAGDANELAVLQALAQIYAAAHRGQTALARQSGAEAATPSLDKVWELFTRQKEMVLALIGGVSAGAASTASSGGGQSPAPPEAEAPAAAVSPPPPEQAAGGSPMSFFKKK